MNMAKLREAEARFLLRYPGGFSHPDIQAISRKHQLEKMHKLAHQCFEVVRFEDIGGIVASVGQIVTKSSLVSVFEKMRFRELIGMLHGRERVDLAKGLFELLYGDQEFGFDVLVDLLDEFELAKWPLLTVCPVYFSPSVEVLVKPNTARRVIAHFELEGLEYTSLPTFAFYRAYRDQINLMKQALKGEGLPSDNAAFCGFLLMAIESGE